METVEDVAHELVRIVDRAAEELKRLDEPVVTHKPDETTWSIKEIIGHLIDSATNNHQRFVRAQEGGVLRFPKYEQDHWVHVQAYNSAKWSELVALWQLYNRHLARVIARTPADMLTVECRIGPYEPVSLAYLVTDYVDHLKHHLRQIDERRVG